MHADILHTCNMYSFIDIFGVARSPELTKMIPIQVSHFETQCIALLEATSLYQVIQETYPRKINSCW